MTMRKSYFERTYGKNHVYNDNCIQCGALIGNYGSYASHPYCTGCEKFQKELKAKMQKAFGGKDGKQTVQSVSL